MTHAELVKRAESWLVNKQNCRFALTEVTTGVGECPDAIGWKYSICSHLVEAKVSRSDLLADRSKPFRKRPELGVGMFRWLMVPSGLASQGDMDAWPGWGLLEVKGRSVHVKRKAEQQAAHNQAVEIGLLVQAVANAQLCAGRNLNEWFAHPDSPIGRTRAIRRQLNKDERNERLLYETRAVLNKEWLSKQLEKGKA